MITGPTIQCGTVHIKNALQTRVKRLVQLYEFQLLYSLYYITNQIKIEHVNPEKQGGLRWVLEINCANPNKKYIYISARIKNLEIT